MRFVRPVVESLQAYVPGEQPQERGLVKLNTNENPYPPSPAVLDAIREAATADLRLYPDPEATAFREAVAEAYGVKPDRILVGNGSDELLGILVRACVEPGDRVAYPVPTYTLYDVLVTLQGARPVRVPFPRNFSLPSELARANARLTIVCNPNSPSGTFVPSRALAELASRIRGLLVVDEAYVEFADEDARPLLDEFEHVVLVRTLSKSHSLAGLRLGFLFASEALVRQLRKVKDSYNVDRIALAAGVAALRDADWTARNVEKVRRTRTRLVSALQELGYRVPPSQANFVLARKPGTRLRETYLELKRRGILVRYFETPELADALRITVGTDDEIDALLRALGELHQD
ncbi:MAG: histidinol-phosphate aminotransferase [Candidatus Binatia bacterium]|nr:MAG: histidinol-phosphate aminotransferase [Candidatus Binatia bacterium]